MSIGSVITRGFSTGVGHQPGISLVITRGFGAGAPVIPPAAVSVIAEIDHIGSGGRYGSGNEKAEVLGALNRKMNKAKRKKEEAFILSYIDEFMRNL